MSFELPSLPYANDALAPYMSAETLDFHHGKHHQTYVTNLNNLLKDNELQGASLEDIVVKSSKDTSMAGIFNNAGQHWNHILFWQCMKPNGGGRQKWPDCAQFGRLCCLLRAVGTRLGGASITASSQLRRRRGVDH